MPQSLSTLATITLAKCIKLFSPIADGLSPTKSARYSSLRFLLSSARIYSSISTGLLDKVELMDGLDSTVK